ncbi:60S ribosomal protein L24 [Cryptosporidium canis]|uniref:60S ribosomal protein L24 n=1 Tax=Cryptosporidium canis TaxID=195482 RepID=A0ABQ8PA95_9CRYT|nr:60S ribosomal protein L24 [Cryptosporidium canis]KAJ1614290.1 60S ribosomal protein L24 [Cryptosporidium canis]
MRIEKCWYCSSNIYPGHGVTFVRNDAKIFRFCRSKCHRHFKMKHNPRKSKWTKAYRKTNGKEMIMDTTFEFEKKRNCPVRYDRELYIKTIKAMKLVDKIKESRKERFYKTRLMKQQQAQKTLVDKETERNATLLRGPEIPLAQTASMSDVSRQKALKKSEKRMNRAVERRKTFIDQFSGSADISMVDADDSQEDIIL